MRAAPRVIGQGVARPCRTGAVASAGLLSTVYWLAGAQACFTLSSGLFLLPLALLWKLQQQVQSKAE